MMHRRSFVSLAALVGLIGALAGPAIGSPLPVPGTGVVVKDSQPDYSWNGNSIAQAVTFPSRRSGAVLAGTLYGPKNLARRAPMPAVVVIPPSGGAATQGSVSYLAKFLAPYGFVGLTVDPQGVGNSGSFGDPPCSPSGEPGRTNPSPCPNVPFQQMDNFFDAGQSALDFLLSDADPWRSHVDAARVGAAGHSEGARAASYLQDPAYDGRVAAVVALDNLSSDYYADAGAPSQEGPLGSTGLQNAVINGEPYGVTGASLPVRPVAPGLGLASDGNASDGQPDEKKTAYTVWRKAGVASMELVLAGVNHLQFSQSSTSNEVLLHKIAVYTAAWFNYFLRHDRTARDVLLARSVLGQPVSEFLSADFRSAFFLPHHLRCEDFRAGCGAAAGG